MFTRIVRPMLAALMAFGMVAAGLFAGASAAHAKVVEPIDSVTITRSDGPGPIKTGDRIRVDVGWSLKDGEASAGDTFSLTLPSALRGFESKTFDLKTESGDTVGTCVVNDTKVTCTYSKFVESHDAVKGRLWFEAVAVATTETDETVWTTDLGTKITVKIPGGAITANTIAPKDPQKTAWLQAKDPQNGGKPSVRWAIDLPSAWVASAMGTQSSLTFTDTFDSQLGLLVHSTGGGDNNASPRVQRQKAETFNSVSGWQTVAPGTGAGQVSFARAVAGTHEFDFTFHAKVEAGWVYRITYDTTIPEGAETGDVWKNTVSSNGKSVVVKNYEYKDAGGDASGNRRNGSISWTKVDQDKAPLAGATFAVTGPDGYAVSVLDNSDLDEDKADGKFKLTSLVWGKYTVKEEKAPAGYQLSEETLSGEVSSDSLTLALGGFTNVLVPGELSWSKVDENDALLAGATFAVTGPDGYAVSVLDNSDLDADKADGKFKLTALAWGQYTVKEEKAPAGYERNEQVLKGAVGGGQTSLELGSVSNKPQLGSLAWTKVGEDKELLAGATFKLTAPDGTVGYIQDNGDLDEDPADGAFAVAELPWGTYTLEETVAPTGHVLDSTVRTLTVDANHLDVTVGAIKNERIPGEVSWGKVDDEGQVLAGSEWELEGPDGKIVAIVDNGELDTDGADGSFTVENLAWGDYTLRETKSPVGHVLEGQRASFTIDATSVKLYLGEAINHRVPGSLAWGKVDGDGEALAGATFSVEAPDGSVITVTDNDDSDTDKEAGRFALAELPWGEYIITETKAPAGYDLDPTPNKVTVGAYTPTVDAGVLVNLKTPPPVTPPVTPPTTAPPTTTPPTTAPPVPPIPPVTAPPVPPTTPVTPPLPETGVSPAVAWVAASAGGLVLLGATLLVVQMRRRRTARD